MKVSELKNLLINKLRRKVMLTEIASALNLDKSSLSWMQKEDRDIKPRQLIRIEDYYEIKINDAEYPDDDIDINIIGRVIKNLSRGL